uniref:Transcriptional regulator n=1 Tax=Candidatus Kentrum sp. DK TaxID=2126562 RepID=A0A450T7I5_9GAMM|nr:MAG: transcriptional regulator [Candidatus Kentron sp. DK]
MTTGIGQRLLKIRGDASQQAFARRIGVNKNTVGGYEREERKPDAEVLRRLIELGFNANWIVTGQGPMRFQEPGDARTKPFEEDCGKAHSAVIRVPAYDVPSPEIRKEEGGKEEVERIPIMKSWLRRESHENPNSLFALRVRGEAMAPTLNEHDIVVAKRGIDSPAIRDGLYVVKMGDGLTVKRVQRLPNYIIKVSSDNADYKPFLVYLREAPEDLEFLGPVVWIGRRV